MELTKGLICKLRMMGISIDGPTSVFCDKKSVVTSTSVPTLTFTKKHLGICYHAVIESVAASIHRIAHMDEEFNTKDVLANLLMAAVKRPHIGRIF